MIFDFNSPLVSNIDALIENASEEKNIEPIFNRIVNKSSYPLISRNGERTRTLIYNDYCKKKNKIVKLLWEKSISLPDNE